MTENEISAALLEWAADYCNTSWEEDEEPAGVKLFVNQAVSWVQSQNGISSESLGDYSVSYFEKMPEGFLKLLRPYRQVKFV